MNDSPSGAQTKLPTPNWRFPRGHLARRAAIGCDHEDVHVAGRHFPDMVEPEGQLVGVFRRRRPVGAGGRRRHLANHQRRFRDEPRERDTAAVGRPGDVARRQRIAGNGRRVPRIHPAHMDLRAAALVGKIGEPLSARRPARAVRLVLASDQRPVVGPIRVHDPDVLVTAVGHHVVEMTHVGDALAIRRDLRIGCVFQLENVHELQRLRRLRPTRDRAAALPICGTSLSSCQLSGPTP